MGERLYQKIGKAIECLLEFILPEPAGCSGCGRTSRILQKYKLCDQCFAQLKRFEDNMDVSQGKLSFDECIVAFCYEGIARELIHRLKYKDRRDAAVTIGVLLSEQLERHGNCYDMIVPVPISKEKRRTRGYNQALLIAQQLASTSGILLEECLIRIKDTKPQVLFNESERWYNVNGCFGCMPDTNLDNKRILLIDDVVTTGATAHNCAEALKAHGARNVTVLAFAKSIMK